MSDTCEIIVPDIPRRIQAALIRTARKQRISVNEQAARILAHTYDVKRQDKLNTRFVEPRSTERMIFEVPVEVRRELRVMAAVNGATMRGLVINALAGALGLPEQPTVRRKRK